MLKNLPVRHERQRPAAEEKEVNPFLQKAIPQTYEEVFRRALSKSPGRKKLHDRIARGATFEREH